jgi:hypothetical protein
MQATRSDLKLIMDNLSRLNETERDEIMKVLQNLKESEIEAKKAKITNLAGLGKEMWHSIDVDKYLKDLRAEWDDREIR